MLSTAADNQKIAQISSGIKMFREIWHLACYNMSLFKPILSRKKAYTKYMCKYHIVFIPKFRRKAIYNKLREDIQKYIKYLCKWKGVEIIEEHISISTIRNTS